MSFLLVMGESMISSVPRLGIYVRYDQTSKVSEERLRNHRVVPE